MILISHRGNLTGKNAKLENKPLQIQKVLDLGFHCEIDVWFINGEYLLGHDEPKIHVKEYMIEHPNLWCHAKNLEALQEMLKNNKIHCFWHESDQYTITSKQFIWTFPGKYASDNCIIVDNSKNLSNYNCTGVCSDYVQLYKTRHF
jgi:hypothetical protein